MNFVLDKLDKKIMHHLCSGVHSYTELAELCHVGRSTIYRRVNRLEEAGVISRMTMAIPNFMKLNLSAMGIGIDVAQTEVNRTIESLKTEPRIKLLWKTYGTHNIIIVAISNKGEEGQFILDLREALERMEIRILKFDASISSTWEKVDLTPY